MADNIQVMMNGHSIYVDPLIEFKIDNSNYCWFKTENCNYVLVSRPMSTDGFYIPTHFISAESLDALSVVRTMTE